ncbi:MAG: outer membrane beta-barrel protein, partial [Saprospiraceae bacterium]|nr:outer membrane beta-barrel protein [Saprospiraceae bacterium]
MKFISNFKNGTHIQWSPYFRCIKSTVLGILILTIIHENLNAQLVKYEKPSWWFGVAGGANLNFYRGSTQQLNATFTPPVAFHDGNGAGLFVTPLLEYHNPSGLGFMLQAGYDNRSSSFDQVISDCNCPADLSTKLSYITVEPSFRFTPGNSNFYLFGGPRIAFNMDKSFIYELGLNPAIPNQLPAPPVTGDLNNVRNTLISMQIGAGFDIPLNSQANELQAVLSPFVSFQPYYGQSPRTVETWNITTLRFGAGIKFGKGSKMVGNSDILPLDEGISFSVYSPKNIPAERRMRETFPLRNYIFFDLGSTEIPDRYVLINKNQVQDFKENQLEVFTPKNLTGRSDREMTVYYNILNIIGDRMQKNPKSVINLAGSSEQGPEDGTKMALSVKK